MTPTSADTEPYWSTVQARPTEADLATVSRHLGRPVRDVVAIGARCQCGCPLVVVTATRLSNGTPFPTTFYLTHSAIVATMSRQEAAGEMARMNERLATDPQLAQAYRDAHQRYLAAREHIASHAGLPPVPEIAGISAGGMPDRVKCLHALAAHSLAVGPGVNPLGDEMLELIGQEWTQQRCRCPFFS